MATRAASSLVLLAALAACGDSRSPSGPEAGPPANIFVYAGGGPQDVVAGQATPIAPAVLITDASNRPVAGVTVTFAIVSGGGSLSNATAVTGSTGVASVTWTVGNTFGLKVLRATAGTLGSVSFNATGIAPDAGIVAFNQPDPTGDTASYSGTPTTKAIDVVSVSGVFKRDSLILTFRFAEMVQPASSGAPNSVYGFVEIDIDDNSATGQPPITNAFGGSAVMGIEYVLDFFGGSPTAMPLFSASGPVSVPASYAGSSVTVSIPMRHLGNDDGNFGLVGLFGTGERPTDFVPNSGGTAVRRPALTAFASPALTFSSGAPGARQTWDRNALPWSWR